MDNTQDRNMQEKLNPFHTRFTVKTVWFILAQLADKDMNWDQLLLLMHSKLENVFRIEQFCIWTGSHFFRIFPYWICIWVLTYGAFFDRELRSKVLKEALLLFLFFLVAWNHEQKMFQMEQKISRTKNAPNGTKKVFADKKCSYKAKWIS